MNVSWGEFLRDAPGAAHAVQIYDDVGELAESVADYLAAGFEAREPAVVIATAEHRRAFIDSLALRGWSASHAEEGGLLAFADAEATLTQLMVDRMPSPESFERVVGGLIDSVADRWPGWKIRAFGEMVDVLSLRGETEAALALERLWNEVARTRNFALLCAYRLDVFDRRAQVASLPGVCRTHSHVLPAVDVERLTHAVDSALDEVVGPTKAMKVYLAARGPAEVNVPLPQLAVMWVSANLPTVADRVLAIARDRYASGSAVSLAG